MRKKLLIGVGLFLAVSVSRLLPHPANVVPISAILLLFPGYSIIVLTSLFLSDAFLGIHSTMIYVYASYLLIGLLGLYGKTLRKSVAFFTFPLLSAMIFYVITNFGVWATTDMYRHDFAGLMQSYWMGIPFLRATFAGDVFFFSLIQAVSFLRRQESRQQFLQYVKSSRLSFH